MLEIFFTNIKKPESAHLPGSLNLNLHEQLTTNYLQGLQDKISHLLPDGREQKYPDPSSCLPGMRARLILYPGKANQSVEYHP